MGFAALNPSYATTPLLRIRPLRRVLATIAVYTIRYSQRRDDAGIPGMESLR